MFNQSLVLAEISPPTREFSVVFISLMMLLVAGACVYAYRDMKSYRRQEKRWTWYKRPLVIGACMIASMALVATLMLIQVTDIIHNNPFVTTLIFALLVAFISLDLYFIFTVAGQKKAEQTER
ncbi:hypothetical protein [Ktedonospora formicarum]|uniref:Uncharacterized protein n=1 Tax=Ktedonospora formicarum TaxID=2778364 RepID=A0A8J3HWL4_9CHLR|nr:hypothetical protein [Ktedonospora formicarum]GHO42188.1 hypothetical protein KSX_03510 [Ktedonospora formicarum]